MYLQTDSHKTLVRENRPEGRIHSRTSHNSSYVLNHVPPKDVNYVIYVVVRIVLIDSIMNGLVHYLQVPDVYELVMRPGR
jgi:hypothetical protein